MIKEWIENIVFLVVIGLTFGIDWLWQYPLALLVLVVVVVFLLFRALLRLAIWFIGDPD